MDGLVPRPTDTGYAKNKIALTQLSEPVYRPALLRLTCEADNRTRTHIRFVGMVPAFRRKKDHFFVFPKTRSTATKEKRAISVLQEQEPGSQNEQDSLTHHTLKSKSAG